MPRRSPASFRRAPTNYLFVHAQLLRMFGLYRQGNKDAEFKYLLVYKRIDKCDKWVEVRRNLEKAKEIYKPDAPAPGASEGRPDGNKGAKEGETRRRGHRSRVGIHPALPRRRTGPGRPS